MEQWKNSLGRRSPGRLAAAPGKPWSGRFLSRRVFDPHRALVPVVHPVAVSVYPKLLCLAAFSSLLPRAPDQWAEGRGQGPAFLLWASAGRKDLITLQGLSPLHHVSQPRPWAAHHSFFLSLVFRCLGHKAHFQRQEVRPLRWRQEEKVPSQKQCVHVGGKAAPPFPEGEGLQGSKEGAQGRNGGGGGRVLRGGGCLSPSLIPG